MEQSATENAITGILNSSRNVICSTQDTLCSAIPIRNRAERNCELLESALIRSYIVRIHYPLENRLRIATDKSNERPLKGA